METLAESKQIAFFWTVLLSLGAFFIPILFFHFISSFTGKKNKFLIIFGYAYMLVLSVSILTTPSLYIKELTSKLNFPFYPTAGPLYFLWVFHYFFYSLLSFLILILSCKEQSSPQKTIQIKYLLVATAAGLLGGGTTFPLWYDIPFQPVGVYFIPFYPILITYAIFKHNLLEIEIVFRKGVIYSILVSAITILYVSSTYILENLFRDIVGYQSKIFSLLIVAVLVIVSQPLKNYIQKLIDKYFFHGSIQEIDEENMKLRNELEKSEKLKAVATLAAGMAHEIKNPLTSIKTFSEYLPEKHNNRRFIDKFSRIVPSEVDKINNIVKQLLEFSKPSELKTEPSDINSILDQTCDLLTNDLLKKHIKIKKDYSPVPSVSIDPVQIKQVFLNLLLNAEEAIGSSGKIELETKVSGGRLLVNIKDNGKGIGKEDLKRVFDPFFSRKDEGSGLGLSVAHGIIQKHKGKIRVSSSSEGTQFQISLPL